jgi:hypothetical protein
MIHKTSDLGRSDHGKQKVPILRSDKIATWTSQNVNPLNVKLNKLSGNLLPMTDHDSSFTLLWKLYGVFMNIIELLMMIVLICGCAHVSKGKILHDGMIFLSNTMEIIFIITQIHVRRDLVRQLICKLNDILHAADENLRNIVTRTLRPIQIPLAFYTIAGVISSMIWCFLPVLTLEKKSVYWNEDYKMPSFFPNEPHLQRTFILYNLFLMFTGGYTVLKKVALDVYIIHLVLLMTAQYRYIRVKTAMILRDRTEVGNENIQERCSSAINWMQERKMIELCHYHNVVIQ